MTVVLPRAPKQQTAAHLLLAVAPISEARSEVVHALALHHAVQNGFNPRCVRSATLLDEPREVADRKGPNFTRRTVLQEGWEEKLLDSAHSELKRGMRKGGWEKRETKRRREGRAASKNYETKMALVFPYPKCSRLSTINRISTSPGSNSCRTFAGTEFSFLGSKIFVGGRKSGCDISATG